MATTINTQQVVTQAAVGVLTVSIMVTAMNAIMTAIGASAYQVAPSELKVPQSAIGELRQAFGVKIVDEAVKNVGTDSAIKLATEVERLSLLDMERKYGATATNAALAAAPAGDIATAHVIADTLAKRGIGGSGIARWLENAPPQQKAQVVRDAQKKTRSEAVPVRDTKTGTIYRSQSLAGMSVAREYDLDNTNTRIWYEVVRRDPYRFERLSEPGVPITYFPKV